MFESSWVRCWRSIGAKGKPGDELMRRLVNAYREPHRKYHTEQHLAECLGVFENALVYANEPDEIEIALWFHDAIYDVRSSDNEARSAEWACRELRQAEVESDRISRIDALIMSTRHEVLPEGRDQQLIVDIDLAILGSKPERFDEYERQIRQEYGFVEESVFRKKREKVLAGLLARHPIYATPVLRELYETQARCNLSRSILALCNN